MTTWSRALALAVCCAGCAKGPHGGAGARVEVPLVGAPAAGDDLLATVDGRPIYASDVALQARSSGSDAAHALWALIDAEALAQEAKQRGLDGAPAVQRAIKSAEVRRLLATTFERELTPADIPQEGIERIWRRLKPTVDHDTYADVFHILVALPKKPTDEQRAQARALAETVAARARGIGSVEAFQELAGSFTWQGRPLPCEEFITDEDTLAEKPFGHAAFKLKSPGDVSGVVETIYGYHVIYLKKYIPPAHTTFEAFEPKMRQGAFPDWQRKQFIKWVDQRVTAHYVEVHPERLK
jgi:peptidyl-prolyl cis-trans isomerase C